MQKRRTFSLFKRMQSGLMCVCAPLDPHTPELHADYVRPRFNFSIIVTSASDKTAQIKISAIMLVTFTLQMSVGPMIVDSVCTAQSKGTP